MVRHGGRGSGSDDRRSVLGGLKMSDLVSDPKLPLPALSLLLMLQ